MKARCDRWNVSSTPSISVENRLSFSAEAALRRAGGARISASPKRKPLRLRPSLNK
jgi:hypothetical protein